MTRSPSAEPAKSCSSKRKGTRSVSTLTPSQLARKRANDREAQRAIRARTKEHIERLEHELEELRSNHGRDKTVQDLIRRNKALEEELRQLKESMGVAINSSPYSAPTGTAFSHTLGDLQACLASHQPQQLLTPCPSAYDDSCGAVPSPRMSPLPTGRADYISDYSQATQQYVPMPNCEAWASTLPSSVPSPSSSVNTEEYGPAAGYIPTSVPSNMLGSTSIGIVDGSKNVKMEYEDVHNIMATQGYMQQAAHHHHQHQHQQHQQQAHQQHQQHQQPHHPRPQNWNMYPGMYYDNSQSTVCVSR
ncbi:hypothetical protein E4U43_003936 [Claviceps pusilla]|uniref:BZIP domain-containing protein n=1 Tax=Claviceps pusilla TaxID=123648 RepID=A0A9P7N417_9HYPO|nr:hypothetical protein E4U43_003936 [Claviceps pusilla]